MGGLNEPRQMKLLGTLIARPLRRDPLRTALTVLAVALGVAVVVAIDLAGDAATGSFQSSLESLAGKTDLEISANGGIDERTMGDLSRLPVDARFAPVIEAQIEIPPIGVVPLYGLDFVAAANTQSRRSDANKRSDADSPDGAVISHSLARRLDVQPGQTFRVLIGGKAREVHIAQIGDGPTDFVALDIAQAQQLLSRYGRLDRIDVTIAPSEDFDRAESAIRAALPAGYFVSKPGARAAENQRMLSAFRWNLRILSYISLVVGAFLIYNTISISVLRRRAEIGVLRALGASRGAVFSIFLTEALCFGIAGGAAGVGLGRLLAGVIVNLIAGTVNALFTTSRPGAIELTAREAIVGIAAGAIAALASAFAPAREAMEIAPTEAMSRGSHEHRSQLRWRRWLAGSAVLAGLALAASQAPPWNHFPAGGYAAAFLAIAAVALATPAFVLAANRATRRLFRRNAEALLAMRSLTGSLSRTSVVAAALATAIAMMASVGIMVGSFRETVALWLAIQLRADLYLRPDAPGAAGVYPPLPAPLEGILRSSPGVAAVDLFRGVELRFRGERATLGAGSAEIVRSYGRLRFLGGEDREAILRSLPDRDRAIVSEPFANRFGVRPGDRIELPIGSSTVALTVAGIYYDYSSSQGLVIVDSSTMLKYLPDQPATNAAVYLAPGAPADAALQEIRNRVAGLGVLVAPNATLRRASLEVFDRTFAITWALEAIAIAVAMLGAANALLAVVLDRKRELGLMRYLGASAGQIRRMILTEAALLGLLASAIGIALGFALSLLLIFVVNKQSFGWTIQFHPPGALLGGALALIWGVTVVAGLYPARVAARMSALAAIREE
jgi:putative ABC transport system permease protein